MRRALSDLYAVPIPRWEKLTRFEKLLMGVFLCLAILFQLLAVYSLGKEALQGAHPAARGLSDALKQRRLFPNGYPDSQDHWGLKIDRLQ